MYWSTAASKSSFHGSTNSNHREGHSQRPLAALLRLEASAGTPSGHILLDVTVENPFAGHLDAKRSQVRRNTDASNKTQAGMAAVLLTFAAYRSNGSVRRADVRSFSASSTGSTAGCRTAQSSGSGLVLPCWPPTHRLGPRPTEVRRVIFRFVPIAPSMDSGADEAISGGCRTRGHARKRAPVGER